MRSVAELPVKGQVLVPDAGRTGFDGAAGDLAGRLEGRQDMTTRRAEA